MPKISIWRETEIEGKEYRVKLGEFTDGFHAGVFIRGLMNEAWEDSTAGRIVVYYDFTEG